jgi:hypothetical protein
VLRGFPTQREVTRCGVLQVGAGMRLMICLAGLLLAVPLKRNLILVIRRGYVKKNYCQFFLEMNLFHHEYSSQQQKTKQKLKKEPQSAALV